jgi:hypothetical protein
VPVSYVGGVTTPSAPQPAEASAPAAEAEEEAPPRCKCGTDRESKFSVVNRDYTFWGLLYLLWGGTAIPSKVSFRCVKCGDLFESTTSRSVCKENVI